MNKKPQKSWGEIQLAIAALAFTATLVLWNMFAVPQKQQVVAQSQDTTVPPAPQDPTETAAPTQAVGFVPVKIIFGGTAPAQPVVVQSAAAAPAARKGGGGHTSRPPVTTGSSKP